jgi:syntaxin 16
MLTSLVRFHQDFRKIHSLLTNIRPSSNAPDETKAARNVQRGLAAKVQDLSSVFRRKQRVYMESEFGLQGRCITQRSGH